MKPLKYALTALFLTVSTQAIADGEQYPQSRHFSPDSTHIICTGEASVVDYHGPCGNFTA